MLPLFQCVTCINCAAFACVYRLKQMEMSFIICLQHLNYFLKLTAFFFFFFFPMLVLKYNEGHSFSSHLVQTAQVNSRPETYGPHGKFPPHVHSTKYIKGPFVFAWVLGMNSGFLSTQRNFFWFLWV